MEFISSSLQSYVEQHSSSSPQLLKQLERETHQKILQPRMLSGFFQGRVLSMLSKLTQPNKILEIGTYTGYSALCLAEGLKEGGRIDTIDCDEELVDFQRKYFDESPFGKSIHQHLGDAKDIILSLNHTYDLVFIDADKSNYSLYFDLIVEKLNPGALLISDNVLWSGKVLASNADEDTEALKLYNKKLNLDSRMETIMLPIRDGLTLSRKKG